MRSADVVGAEAAAGAAPPLGDTAPRDRRRLGVAFWLSVGWIGVVVLAALLADVLPLGSTSHTHATVVANGEWVCTTAAASVVL